MAQKARFTYKQGRLHMGKANLSMLARQFGTPAYIYDGDRISENYNNLHKALSANFKDVRVCYAIKANANMTILKQLAANGASADCSSAIEVQLAKEAGFDLSTSMFTSVNPTDEDLQMAMKHKMIMNLDDFSHLARVLAIGRPHTICFRINPGISAGKHEQIRVGGKGTKFGIDPEDAMKAYSKSSRSGIVHFGIHMMAGSGILDPKQFSKATKKLLKTATNIVDNLGITFDFINIGGGIGIPYESNEEPIDLKELSSVVKKEFSSVEKKIGNPTLVMEPGRYIVGDAGILLTSVNTIKETKEHRFTGVDAGMTSLIRPMLYGAHHNILPIKQRPGRPIPHTVVGPICENTDCFGKDYTMPKVQEGDVLSIMDVGAYGFSMSSQFNGRLRPVEVMLEGTKTKVIRRREEFKDILLE